MAEGSAKEERIGHLRYAIACRHLWLDDCACNHRELPQRIFLPNDRAVEPQARTAYERFGLNERQIDLIARATPKRHYYLQSRRGNRLIELGLGPIALALCGASDPASQALIDGILSEHGREGFASRFLNARGLDWAAELLRQFPQPDKEQSP